VRLPISPRAHIIQLSKLIYIKQTM